MTDTPHPFSRDRIDAVADERGVSSDDLDAALADVQRALARTDGEYEYSSEHNYGWRDDDAYYLYGAGIWETLGRELSLPDAVLTAACEVHRRAMLDAAAARDERETVEEMFTDGSEPLVLTNTATGPPRFGQDV